MNKKKAKVTFCILICALALSIAVAAIVSVNADKTSFAGGKEYLPGEAEERIGADPSQLVLVRDPAYGAVGQDSVELTWRAPQESGCSYAIYCRRASDGGEYRFLGETDALAYTALGLEPGTEYDFAIGACRTVGGNRYTADSYAQVQVTTVAPPVRNLTLTLSMNRSYLCWDPSPGAEGYEIYRDTGSDPVYCGSTTATRYRGNNITAASYYTYTVRTYQFFHDEKAVSSAEASASDWSLPETPNYSIRKSEENADDLILSWRAIPGADAYEILTRSTPDGAWERLMTTNQTTCTVKDTDPDGLYLAVRSVMYAGGREYRGDYRIRWYSPAPTGGRIGSYGDSIAWGAGSHHYAYTEMIARSRNLQYDNRSYNGATLCLKEGKHSVLNDVRNYIRSDSAYDYLLVEGGINDYYFNCPLGEVTPEGTDDFDLTTVCGALERIFTHIRTTVPDAQTVFVILHDVTDTATAENALGLTFSDYLEGIRAVCEKYGVKIADVGAVMKTGESEISKLYTDTRYGVYPDSDGVHPNESGYLRFYVPVIEKALFG